MAEGDRPLDLLLSDPAGLRSQIQLLLKGPSRAFNSSSREAFGWSVSTLSTALVHSELPTHHIPAQQPGQLRS